MSDGAGATPGGRTWERGDTAVGGPDAGGAPVRCTASADGVTADHGPPLHPILRRPGPLAIVLTRGRIDAVAVGAAVRSMRSCLPRRILASGRVVAAGHASARRARRVHRVRGDAASAEPLPKCGSGHVTTPPPPRPAPRGDWLPGCTACPRSSSRPRAGRRRPARPRIDTRAEQVPVVCRSGLGRGVGIRADGSASTARSAGRDRTALATWSALTQAPVRRSGAARREAGGSRRCGLGSRSRGAARS